MTKLGLKLRGKYPYTFAPVPTPIIPAFRRKRQRDGEFGASLGYAARSISHRIKYVKKINKHILLDPKQALKTAVLQTMS